ncbi:MAG: hypothetical protein KF718_14225 [Polyangiaceae bacterium]|nr:hypothetical protein [Polyangiaceae bacterium]
MPAGGLAFVLGLGAVDAWAQSCPFTPPKTVTLAGSGTSCEFLPRPPVLLEPRLGAECIMDEDGNGLDDEMEEQIARCFVPEFRFDVQERLFPWPHPDGLQPPSLAECEPVMGFSAYRVQGQSDEDVLIRVRYVALFRHDGGFVEDGSVWCGDAHAGDAQGFAIDVRVEKAGVWRARFASLSECSNPTMAGTRPVLYPSAGKHHWKCFPGVSDASVTFGLSCNDPHRGNGVVRVPTALFRTPQSYLFHSISNFNVTFANVCHFGRTGELSPATRFQTSRLDNLGFAGESLHQSFYSGGVTAPGAILAPDGAFTVDADGDGLPEIWRVESPDWVLTTPTDPCPLDATNPADLDADGLTGKCDPDPNFRQKYVGTGEPGLPAVPPPHPKWGLSVSGWGGFWDSDQDGGPNGIDACPSLANSGASTLSNRWAEDVNWPPHPLENNELGFFQRGETCDPYPVSFSKWRTLGSPLGSQACGPPKFVGVGSDYAEVRTSGSRGVSANDPYWDAPSPDPKPTWLGNRYRCACRNRVTGAPLPGTACVLDQQSDCFRNTVRAAGIDDAVGRGWRPIDRPGCARDAQSWCVKQLLPVPRFDVGWNSAVWSWKAERELFGPSAAAPHYAPSDVTLVPGSLFTGTEHTRLNHQYALWSLIELDQPPAFATQRPGSFYPDPEYDELGRGDALHNVQSAQSIRLRSMLYEEPKKDFVSAHDVLTVGLTCVLLDLSQLLAQVELWFGPDPVLPERTEFSSLRALDHDGDLTRAAVLRPAERNYAGVRVGAELLEHWAALAPVSLAPIRGQTPRATGTLSLTPGPPDGSRRLDAEPELLALERDAGSDPPRWARLVPVHSTDTILQYTLVAEGTARGPLSPATTFVSDATGRGAVAVDLETGFVEALIYGDAPPARHELPPELLGRTGAAMTLHGHNLLVAGGSTGATLATDLWLADLHTGMFVRLRDDLPARRGARLFVTPSASHVHLTGGTGPSGARHDDVWQLSDFQRAPGQAPPRRLFSDTRQPAAFEPRTSPLLFDPYGGELLQIAFDSSIVEGTTLRERTSFGWEAIGNDGAVARCAAGDPGGTLCGLDAAWWATPGRVPCGGGACDGAPGALERVQKLGPPALAVDADESGAWLLGPKHVERWRPAEDGQLARVASAALPKSARDVAARSGSALVATADGVHLVTDSATGVELSPRLPLCGSPYRVAALGSDVWAVATTLGLALVSNADGALRVESMSLLLPHAGGALVPLPVEPSGEPACALASALHPLGLLLGPKSALGDAGNARLLFAIGHQLFDLDASVPTAPTLRATLSLAFPLSHLRADPVERRAYGASVLPAHRPAFDLRGPAAAHAGTHAVTSWVKRRDAGPYRVRQWAAFAEVAQVTP